MKKLILIFLIFFAFDSLGQTIQENMDWMEKYWFYRNRLKNEFIYYTNFSPIAGSHQVIENRANYPSPYDAFDYIRLGDATQNLGYYIGLLALEYKLLNINGQDKQGTLTELNLALDAFERLDFNAETCFGGSQGVVNGFFLRDDMPSDENLKNYFNVENIYSGYAACCNKTDGNVISQDQVIGLFFGFTLVNRFVDDAATKVRVKSITSDILDAMQTYYSNWPPLFPDVTVWEIRNPVTGEIVPLGGNWAELYTFSRSFAIVGGNITNQNENKFYSDAVLTNTAWKLAQNSILFFINNQTLEIPIIIALPALGIPPTYIKTIEITGEPFNANLIAKMSTLSNEWGSGKDNLYEWLVDFNNDTKGKFGMPSDIGVFPHLPLIANILWGHGNTNLIDPSFYENRLFNTAPPCGARHYTGDFGPEDWTDPPWHTLSIFSPYHNLGLDNFDGDYTMIDYMIMYNAYFLTYVNTEMPTYINDTDTYPYVTFEIEWDINGYPDTIWHYTYTCNSKKYLIASRQIDSKSIVNNDGGLVYTSGKKIILLPGFSVKQGGCFKAQINPEIYQDFFYHQTNVDPCNGGTFEPLIANNIDVKINDEKIQTSLAYEENIQEEIDNINNESIDFNINSDNINNGNNSSFSISPNPSKGKFKITIPENEVLEQIIVTDYMGLVIISYSNLSPFNNEFDLSTNKNGLYYVKIKTNKSFHSFSLYKIKYLPLYSSIITSIARGKSARSSLKILFKNYKIFKENEKLSEIHSNLFVSIIWNQVHRLRPSKL